GVFERAQVHQRKLIAGLPVDRELKRLSIDRRKHRAKNLVPPYNFGNAGVKASNVKVALEPEHPGQVVGCRTAGHLFYEPDPFLRKGQGSASFRGPDRNRASFRSLASVLLPEENLKELPLLR